MKPKVNLISWTNDPVGTIYQIWESSRGNRPLEDIQADILEKKSPQVFEVFQKVIDSKIPVAENIQFVFILENVSISFREQMVRHRIGVKVGERLGIDIAPNLADSTWWSQSMRILDMGKFADEGRYRMPEGLTPDQEREFHAVMVGAQDAYNRLVSAGVKNEEAREVIPLGATHTISWALNLTSLQHIIGKRGCQILQLGLWEPIIRGMVEELATKVHPYFRNLINPPCVKGDKFTGCIFKLDNERRLSGEDPLPPCTLYIGCEADEENRRKFIDGAKYPEMQMVRFDKAALEYRNLWGRNPFTGKRVEK